MLLIGGCVKSGDWGGKSVCLSRYSEQRYTCRCKVLYIYYPDLRYQFSPHACQQVFRHGRAVYSIDAVNITAMSLRIKVFVSIYTKHVNHHVICSKHMDRSIEKCFCVGFASFNLAKRGPNPTATTSPDSVYEIWLGLGLSYKPHFVLTLLQNNYTPQTVPLQLRVRSSTSMLQCGRTKPFAIAISSRNIS